MEDVKNYPPYLDYPKPYKAQTNADRIRTMSDEEMAKKLEYELGCPVTGDCAKMSRDCNACWLDWLQQPAEKKRYKKTIKSC